MTTVVILKILADVGLYYTIAGFFAALFGASAEPMFLSVPILALCVTLSYCLREKGNLRFAPFVLLLSLLLLPNTGIASLIAALPFAVYAILISAKRLYIPDWTQQVDIFSFFWKIFIVIFVIGLVGQKMQVITSVVIPMAVISGGCSILLMRSLRHEPEVYCEKKYQITNIIAIVLVGIAALLLSSKVFIAACVWLIKALYSYVISPILMGLIYVVLGLMQGIAWLASFVKLGFKKPDDENALELNITSAEDLFDFEEQADTGNTVEKVFIAIGILILAFIAFKFFKYIMGKKSETNEKPAETVRYRADPRKNSDTKPERGSAVARVRAQYRRFLKLCKDNGIVPEKSDTTRDINSLCQLTFDNELTSELREIYINARYDGAATKEDAANAKKICDEIKKKIPK
jgi:hypothetical protein